jgi:hypothetical protein
MAKVIICECGHVVRGATYAALLANAEAHIRREHPELVGRITAQDLLDMAEEA